MHGFGFLMSKNFFSLGNLITSAQRQRQTASYDSAADFFVRRLQENERTLAILTLRIEKSFPNEVELISDLNELHSMVNELTRDFVRAVEECELILHHRLHATNLLYMLV